MITFSELGSYGRLGNQMFQIASTIGIATKNNHEFEFPEWVNHDHLNRFNSSEDINISNYFVKSLPKKTNNNYTKFNVPWGYHDVILQPNINYDIMGHMQSEKYFKHCEPLIKEYFELKNDYNHEEKVRVLAIHVRLGDYDGNYHPRLTLGEYYNPVIEELKGKFDKIYWFSDDISLLKKQINNEYDNVFIEGNHYMEDFKIMKSCNHFIIGNSTFSWWAAWLSKHDDKIVVAPRKWFGQVAKISSNDLYCENWLVR